MISCSNKPEPFKIGYQSKIFTEQKVIDFVNANPDLNSTDSLKKAEALDKFQHEIKGISNNVDFLKDFPLQVTNIRDTLMGNQSFVIATFNAFEDKTRDKKSIMNQMRLHINGIFQYREEATYLRLGQKYQVVALVYKQGKRADVNYTDKNGRKIYNLGVYPMQIKEFKLIKSKEKFALLN